MKGLERPSWRRLAVGLAVVTAVSIGLLVWFTVAAVRQWGSSSRLIADRRVEEAAVVLSSALMRDMQGAQRAFLLSADVNDYVVDPSYDVINLFASGFARYPYVESFFAWRADAGQPAPTMFNRWDRPPSWAAPYAGRSRFPVVFDDHEPSAVGLLGRIQQDVQRSRPFSLFEIELGGVSYQVIARLFYRDSLRQRIDVIVGFTVNLAWIRRNYFPQLTEQISHVAGAAEGLAVSVRDEHAHAIVGAAAGASPGIAARLTQFPLYFFDPSLVAASVPADLTRRLWNVEATLVRDPGISAAAVAGRWMILLGSLAAAAVAGAIAMAVRASRESTRLINLRSDFVAAVTHELKTPIATIRAIGETMQSGRAHTSFDREFAPMVVQEAKRLTRFVDNLLVFSRITDVAEIYHHQAVSVVEVLREVMERFEWQLADSGFDVSIQSSDGSPVALVDRDAVRLMLDNIVDNAIRYSGLDRRIEIQVFRAGAWVTVEITDHGRGIAADEVDFVTRKFYRGRNAGSGGSGLGLAIVQRIVAEHGGTFAIRSVVDVGTTVTVRLPAVSA